MSFITVAIFAVGIMVGVDTDELMDCKRRKGVSYGSQTKKGNYCKKDCLQELSGDGFFFRARASVEKCGVESVCEGVSCECCFLGPDPTTGPTHRPHTVELHPHRPPSPSPSARAY